MDVTVLQDWIANNPALSLASVVGLLLLIYLISRLIFGRGLTALAAVTRNKYDDILVKKMHLYRAAWLFPLLALYLLAFLSPTFKPVIEKFALFFILWVGLVTVNGFLDALNEIYESSKSFRGVAVQGYVEIVKLLLILVGIILSISLFTNKSPLLLLSGLGAATAVLLLVFHDTFTSLIASIQITINDLVKEGDWLEVPSFDADGEVINVSLYIIKIQNWDKTITVIPTAKLLDVAYKNWRGMQESGGRRIMRALHLDQTSIRFCTPVMIDNYGKINLVSAFIADRKDQVVAYRDKYKPLDSPLDGPQLTNVEVFRAYVEAYICNHPNIHTEDMDLIIRELAPSSTGLPMEVYAFTRTTKWSEYERIQGEIFDHLLAAATYFDLRVFQQPTGSDFSNALRSRA
jgi:miniconductance mechanosensitive channel